MLTQKLLQCCTSMAGRRFISRSIQNFESKAGDSAGKASSTTTGSSSQAGMPGKSLYIPSDFDKWLLVWVKRYPKGQVPEKITQDIIHQAKSKARVKTANYMMLGIIVMCVSTIFYSKNAIKHGDSIQKRRDDWRQQVIEEGKKEREQAAVNK